MIAARRAFVVPSNVTCSAWSPDERELALSLDSGGFLLIDLESGQRQTFGHSGRGKLHEVDWLHFVDKQTLLIYGYQGRSQKLLRFDRQTATMKPAVSEENTPFVTCWDGVDRLLLQGRDSLRIVDPETLKQRGNIDATGELLAARGDRVLLKSDGELRLLQLPNLEPLERWAIDIDPVQATISPDGQSVLAANWHGPVLCARAGQPHPVQIASQNNSPLAFSRDGALALVGNTLFELATLRPLISLVADKMAFSPSAETLLLLNDGLALLLDPERLLERQHPIGPSGRTTALAVSPDGTSLAVGSEQGLLFVYRLPDLQPTWVLDPQVHEPEALCFSTDSRRLFSSGPDGISVFDVETAELSASWRLDENRAAKRFALSRDGKQLLAGTHDRVFLIDSGSGRQLATFGPWIRDGYEQSLEDCDMHPDATHLSVCRDYGDTDGLVIEVATQKVVRRLRCASRIRFDPDGSRLFVCADGEGWSEQWPRTKKRPKKHRLDGFSDLAFPAGNGELLLVDGNDQVGSVNRTRPVDEYRWHCRYHDDVHKIAVDDRRQRWFSGGHGCWIGERSLSDGSLLRTAPAGTGDTVAALCFDREGEQLLVADRGGRLQQWDLQQHRLIGLLDSSSTSAPDSGLEYDSLSGIEAIQFSADGASLYLALAGRLARYDWSERQLSAEPERVWEGRGNYSQLSADGRSLLTDGRYGEPAQLWSVVDDRLLGRFSAGSAWDSQAHIAPDGSQLVIQSNDDNRTQLARFDTGSGQRTGTLQIAEQVTGCVFSPDGELIVWCDGYDKGGTAVRWKQETRAGEDPVVRFLDRENCQGIYSSQKMLFLPGGKQLLALLNRAVVQIDVAAGLITQVIACAVPGQSGNEMMAVSNDGRLLAVADHQGRVAVWDLAHGTLLAVQMVTKDGAVVVEIPGQPRRVTPGPFWKEVQQ